SRGRPDVKRLAPLALLLALSSPSAQALRLPSAPACPIFPKTNAWNKRIDSLPVAPNSDAIIRAIGAGTGLHPDFGSGPYRRRPHRHPVRRRHEEDAPDTGVVRLRGRERQRPVSDPPQGPRRERQRPARAADRPERVQALRAVRPRADSTRLARRLRSGLEPALEPAQAGGLDVR